MPKTYTFSFQFLNPNDIDNPVTEGWDETQFCACDVKDAVECFEEWIHNDENLDIVPEYSIEVVYEQSDADYYENEDDEYEYGTPEEYYKLNGTKNYESNNLS